MFSVSADSKTIKQVGKAHAVVGIMRVISQALQTRPDENIVNTGPTENEISEFVPYRVGNIA